MKFLKILLVIFLLVSFMPLDAFCDGHQDTAEHHHGIVICHAHCHGAVLASSALAGLPEISSSFNSTHNFTYEGPILPAEVKPPKFFS